MIVAALSTKSIYILIQISITLSLGQFVYKVITALLIGTLSLSILVKE